MPIAASILEGRALTVVAAYGSVRSFDLDELVKFYADRPNALRLDNLTVCADDVEFVDLDETRLAKHRDRLVHIQVGDLPPFVLRSALVCDEAASREMLEAWSTLIKPDRDLYTEARIFRHPSEAFEWLDLNNAERAEAEGIFRGRIFCG